MSGITYLTRQAWRDWHLDRDRPSDDPRAECDACGTSITIGKVGGFVPAVDDKPIELICDTCILKP